MKKIINLTIFVILSIAAFPMMADQGIFSNWLSKLPSFRSTPNLASETVRELETPLPPNIDINTPIRFPKISVQNGRVITGNPVLFNVSSVASSVTQHLTKKNITNASIFGAIGYGSYRTFSNIRQYTKGHRELAKQLDEQQKTDQGLLQKINEIKNVTEKNKVNIGAYSTSIALLGKDSNLMSSRTDDLEKAFKQGMAKQLKYMTESQEATSSHLKTILTMQEFISHQVQESKSKIQNITPQIEKRDLSEKLDELIGKDKENLEKIEETKKLQSQISTYLEQIKNLETLRNNPENNQQLIQTIILTAVLPRVNS